MVSPLEKHFGCTRIVGILVTNRINICTKSQTQVIACGVTHRGRISRFHSIGSSLNRTSRRNSGCFTGSDNFKFIRIASRDSGSILPSLGFLGLFLSRLSIGFLSFGFIVIFCRFHKFHCTSSFRRFKSKHNVGIIWLFINKKKNGNCSCT